MLDLGQGRGSYDAAVVAAYFYGDLIAGDHMAPVDPLLASGRFPRWSYDAMPPALRSLYSWDGVGYGVLNDADGQVLYYRRDVLSDPANQAAFKAGAGLRPARTAADLAAGPRHRPLLRRQELGPSRQPAGQRDGPASQAGRAGLLPLPVAVGGVRRGARAPSSTATTTSTGSTRRT